MYAAHPGLEFPFALLSATFYGGTEQREGVLGVGHPGGVGAAARGRPGPAAKDSRKVQSGEGGCAAGGSCQLRAEGVPNLGPQRVCSSASCKGGLGVGGEGRSPSVT